jgi:hypothetical protein
MNQFSSEELNNMESVEAAARGAMDSHAPMTARIVTVGELLSLGSFAPASVQRDFQWERSNSNYLLSDLDRSLGIGTTEEAEADQHGDPGEDVDEPVALSHPTEQRAAPLPPLSEYYLGTMVIRRMPDGLIEVFDGLQRITALTILFCVMRDLSPRMIADQLHHFVSTPTGDFRLRLTGRNRTLPQQIQRRGEAIRHRHSDVNDVGQRIRSAARLYRDVLKTWDPARLEQFADRVRRRVSLTLIEVDDIRLARQIFITTNMRGLRLDRVDLLKGQLIDLGADDAAAADISKRWDDLRSLVGDELDELLMRVDFIERRAPQGADCLTDLAEHVAYAYGNAGILKWMERLREFGMAWVEMQERLESVGTEPGDKDLWMLRFFDWDEWKPLALLWYRDYFFQRGMSHGVGKRACEAMARRFGDLHRKCMAVTLAGYSDSDRAAIFGRAIAQTIGGRNVFRVGKVHRGALTFNPAAQERMRHTLSVPISDDHARVVLRWLEALLWDKTPPVELPRATVEHVLPERPDPSSQWVKDFPDELARDVLCRSLGNMTLLSPDDNEKRAANRDFNEKVLVYRAPR